MTETVETLVIGAGVVGLAIAASLAAAGREVVTIDEAQAIGTATSSRNSEVIHRGIYYPPGSLKARLCIAGRDLLREFCAAAGVETRWLGKLIVATSAAEVPKLETILATARANGVSDLVWLGLADVLSLEPDVVCAAALLSPGTGIIDSQNYMMALQGQIEAGGSSVALRTRFTAARREGGAFEAELLDEGGAPFALRCKNIVNAAGHGAHAAARAIVGLRPSSLPPRFMAKGSYCSVSGRSPFRHLVYPVPVPGALGIHATLDMAGRLRLGPNIEWVETLEYSLRTDLAAEFAAACAGFWPGVWDREIVPSYCGIRPKIHGPGAEQGDFRIDGPKVHGVEGLVNLFGIESPGLTASLAIGRHVSQMLGQGNGRV